MKNITTKQIEKNLKRIQNVLNQHENWEEEYRTYSLTPNKDNLIQLKICCDDEITENYTIEIESTTLDNTKDILKTIINFLYTEEINYRHNYIRKTKSVYKSKAKSLALWLSRGNADRVNKINREVADRYNTTKNMENEVNKYKKFVRDLYNCLNVLCPNWKVEDIEEYLENELTKRNKNFTIEINKNSLIIDEFRIDIDIYSKKNEILNKVLNKLVA